MGKSKDLKKRKNVNTKIQKNTVFIAMMQPIKSNKYSRI